MDLSIIIVNWNTKELLARCLESLEPTMKEWASMTWPTDQLHPDHQGYGVEVFVVDNASTDDSTEMVRQRFPWVKLIENADNVGFARANNQAICQSRGSYVLLLNSDTEVYPGALDLMVQFLRDNPQAGGCGPQLLNADGSFQESCYPLLTPEREFWRLTFLDKVVRRATYAQERWNRESSRQVEVIKGACFLLRRVALEQVGLLDEQYFMYTEEMDLCYRLTQAGWQLWWMPKAIVVHHGEASTKQVAESMYVQLYRSKSQFHHKFGGSRRVRRFKVLIGLAYVPRLVVAALGSCLSPSLATRASTYRHLLSELAKM